MSEFKASTAIDKATLFHARGREFTAARDALIAHELVCNWVNETNAPKRGTATAINKATGLDTGDISRIVDKLKDDAGLRDRIATIDPGKVRRDGTGDGFAYVIELGVLFRRTDKAPTGPVKGKGAGKGKGVGKGKGSKNESPEIHTVTAVAHELFDINVAIEAHVNEATSAKQFAARIEQLSNVLADLEARGFRPAKAA